MIESCTSSASESGNGAKPSERDDIRRYCGLLFSDDFEGADDGHPVVTDHEERPGAWVAGRHVGRVQGEEFEEAGGKEHQAEKDAADESCDFQCIHRWREICFWMRRVGEGFWFCTCGGLDRRIGYGAWRGARAAAMATCLRNSLLVEEAF